MLLISRAEKFPQPDAPWLLQTRAAVAQLTQSGEVLITGTGRLAYDAARFANQSADGATIIVCATLDDCGAGVPPANCGAGVPPATTLLIFPEKKPSSKAWPELRDRVIAALSTRATAVHIRKAGNMAALVESLRQRGIPVDSAPPLEIPKASEAQPRSPAPPGAILSESALSDWPYLTHFTRNPDGPWPGEPRDDYLRWLCSGPSAPHRDAFAALCRILDERRLRGCGRLIVRNAPMVCFTARKPSAVATVTRWRRGLLRWTFTRYALAVPRARLERAGARPVRYVSAAERDLTSSAEQKFTQLSRSGDHDWSQEQEWRVAGDFDLTAVPTATFLACVAHEHEAAELFKRYGIRSILLPANF